MQRMEHHRRFVRSHILKDGVVNTAIDFDLPDILLYVVHHCQGLAVPKSRAARITIRPAWPNALSTTTMHSTYRWMRSDMEVVPNIQSTTIFDCIKEPTYLRLASTAFGSVSNRKHGPFHFHKQRILQKHLLFDQIP